ncbi:MAG: acyl carrier protein [Rhodoferax sp.]|jgi:acyl carrier protein|nr:acyl carrier protein [Rhodoferax sp.]
MTASTLKAQLTELFADSLGLGADKVVDELRYAEVPQWDSIAHMALIAAIEERFDIMIDAEDVINMSSFAAAQAIVAKYIPPQA